MKKKRTNKKLSPLQLKIKNTLTHELIEVDYSPVTIEGGQTTIKSMVEFPPLGKHRNQFIFKHPGKEGDPTPVQKYICPIMDNSDPDINQGLVMISTSSTPEEDWSPIPTDDAVLCGTPRFFAFYYKGSTPQQPFIANVRDFYNQQAEITPYLNDMLEVDHIIVDLVTRKEAIMSGYKDLPERIVSIRPKLGNRKCYYLLEAMGQLIEVTDTYSENYEKLMERIMQLNAITHG